MKHDFVSLSSDLLQIGTSAREKCTTKAIPWLYRSWQGEPLHSARWLPEIVKPFMTGELLRLLPKISLSEIKHSLFIINPSFQLIKQLLIRITDLSLLIKQLLVRITDLSLLINRLFLQKKAFSGFMIGFLGGFDHSPPKKPNELRRILHLLLVINNLLRIENYLFRVITVRSATGQ